MAEKWSMVCDQRANFSQTHTWTDLDDNPVDLSGYSALMEIRDTSDTLILALSTANSRVTLGGAAGTIELTIAAADTETLDPGTYDYDLTLTSGSGTVTRLLEGVFTVNEAVTQV